MPVRSMNSWLELPWGVTSSRQRVTLTKAQRATNAGTELLALLVEITADGELSDEEVVQLGNWLADNDDLADLTAISFLTDLVARIVEDCRIDADERLDLAVAIERVMPKEERLFAKEQRLLAKEAKPEPATERQLQYLLALGGECTHGMTKSEATKALTELLRSPGSVSEWQMMVLRFWGQMDVAETGRQGVSEWLEAFYEEDGDRREAWDLWKTENLDLDFQDEDNKPEPSIVPVGVGPLFLARVKDTAL